jgi:hypothetical protein
MSEPTVNIPISELLRKIDEKIDKLIDALSTKADKAELHALAVKVDSHDDQLKTLLAANVAAANERKSQTEWRRWMIPIVISVASVIATALQVWH